MECLCICTNGGSSVKDHTIRTSTILVATSDYNSQQQDDGDQTGWESSKLRRQERKVLIMIIKKNSTLFRFHNDKLHLFLFFSLKKILAVHTIIRNALKIKIPHNVIRAISDFQGRKLCVKHSWAATSLHRNPFLPWRLLVPKWQFCVASRNLSKLDIHSRVLCLAPNERYLAPFKFLLRYSRNSLLTTANNYFPSSLEFIKLTLNLNEKLYTLSVLYMNKKEQVRMSIKSFQHSMRHCIIAL